MSQGISVTLAELIQLQHQALQFKRRHKKKVHTLQGANYLSTMRGRGMDFEEARMYQAGDDARCIDWRVTARTNVVHTKIYQEERERPVLFLVDLSLSMRFATRVAFKSVIAARVAALLAWASAREGDRIGGIVFSDNEHFELRPRSRQLGVISLLKNISELSAEQPAEANPQALNQALQRLRAVTRPGSLIFILSDFMYFDISTERCLTQLSRHNEIVAGFVFDPLEKTPPTPNHYAISDGQMTLAMNTAATDFQQQYIHYFQERLAHLQSVLKRRKIPLIELATNEPISKILGAL